MPQITPRHALAATLILVLGFLPFFILDRWFIGGYILVIGLALAVLAWLWTTPRLALSRQTFGVDWLIFLFFIIAILSAIFSHSRIESFDGLLLLTSAAVFFLIARSCADEHTRIGMAVAIVVIGLVTTTTAFAYALRSPGESIRLYGVFRNPDAFGPSLIIPLFFNLGLLALCARRWQRTLFTVTGVILAGALLMASAVSSIVGILLASTIGAIILRFRPRGSVIVGAVSALVLALVLMFFFRQGLLHEQSTTTSVTGFASSVGAVNSWRQRLSFAQASFDMARTHPMTGIGLYLWADLFPQYQHSILEHTQTPHGFIFKILGELGWPGALVFVALFLMVCVALARVARMEAASALTKFGTVGIVAAGIAAMIDIPWGHPATMMLFWICAGCFLAPATTTVKRALPKIVFRGSMLAITVLILGYGVARFTTTYLVDQVNRAAKRHDAVDVIATASVARRILPSPVEITYMASFFNLSQFISDQDTARSWFEQSLRSDPYQPAAYHLWGKSTLEKGDPQKAESLFQKGLMIDPYFSPGLAVDLGQLYMQQQRYKEAELVTTTMLSHVGADVTDRDTQLFLLSKIAGASELAQDNLPAAREHFTFALHLKPTDEEIQTLLREVFKENDGTAIH